jgi:large subunit ribosomal protein L6
MSRIGKLPVPIPKGVDVKIDGASVTVKGKNGSLSRILRDVSVEKKDGSLVLEPTRSDRQGKAYWGLARALLNNMVVGVSEGFVRKLDIVGTGYKAEVQGQTMVINIGFSHPVELKLPESVKATVEKNTHIELRSADKEAVGQMAAKIRAVRKPEPYKGKGIRYAGEVISLKAGKAGK